ncbi:MAG: DUF1049 domain-containing protein [Betaproteobacteria bacterium]|nr:DUF1049 domain-containing protein [Betaproteobacteria bacterium]
MMRIVRWTLRLALFLVLVALAAKNVEPVTLRFYFDLGFQAPLAVLLFAAFALGALAGMLALLGTVLSQRKALSRLKDPRKPDPDPGFPSEAPRA